MKLRPYQTEAVNAVYEYLRANNGNPCVVLPAGTGKSLVLAQIVRDAVTLWNGRVIILAHVKELLEQNADKIRILCPNIPIGIYSAGLNSRDKHEDVIVAGIQSVYSKACELGSFDLIITDECHSISPDGEGMYRTFLKDMQVINPNVRLIGLTATPFRLKGGLICKPENFLNDVCYDAGLKEMIQQGYLSPLVARAGGTEADFDKLHIRGGEFISDEVAAAMDVEELVDAACREIVALTRDRQSVLIFTAGVEHCQHVADKIAYFSQSECAVVTGSTPATERAEFIARFRGELDNGDLFGHKLKPLKYLANVNVLTTGFDAPNTDCVVLLRPTNSPGLLIQMVGRGSRLSPATGKKDCLVLDYGGNILRHGPIDMIRVTDRTPGSGDAPAKKCPGCSLLIHAAYQTCPDCGWQFPPPERKNIDQTASRAGIISGEISHSEHQVASVHYSVHEKYGADESTPKTMRVDYEIGDRRYVAEWVCPEHTGYAREKFVRWWRARARESCPTPTTATEAVALAEQECLAPALRIKLKYVSGEKYDRVVGHSLGEKPPWPPPPDNSADQWPPASIGYRSIPQWPPLPDCLRPLANTHAATAPSHQKSVEAYSASQSIRNQRRLMMLMSAVVWSFLPRGRIRLTARASRSGLTGLAVA